MLRAAFALAVLGLVACTTQQVTRSTGPADYRMLCQGCHGTKGRGDGPMAPHLERKPADLTHIAKRNGGTFPMVQVMSQIDGFTRMRRHGGGGPMPEFGALLQGETVLYDGGSGRPEPVPARLLALATYLKGLQQP